MKGGAGCLSTIWHKKGKGSGVNTGGGVQGQSDEMREVNNLQLHLHFNNVPIH